jgi:hypothetical protein
LLFCRDGDSRAADVPGFFDFGAPAFPEQRRRGRANRGPNRENIIEMIEQCEEKRKIEYLRPESDLLCLLWTA